MRQVLPLVLSANTLAVMWLAGSRKRLGWALGLGGQALWLWFIVMFEAWGLLPLTLSLIVVYARNFRKWGES